MGSLDDAHAVSLDEADAPDDRLPETAEEAVRTLLLGLGEDPDREGLRRTPHRVAKAFREGTRGYSLAVDSIVESALFPEAGVDTKNGSAGGTGGLVVVRDIDLFSYCESCLLPFGVQCHVGYVPSAKRVLGLSKLSRVADVFAKRLQSPQRLANEICTALHNSIEPSGVVVALHCWHIPLFDALVSNEPQGWVKSSFSSRSGIFEDTNSSLFDDFLALLKFRNVMMESSSISESWCPMRSLESPLCNGHGKNGLTNGIKPSSLNRSMVSAVSSVLQSFGEDPSRKELVGTPHRYAQWLMKFKFSGMDARSNGLTVYNMNGCRNNCRDDHHQSEYCSCLHLPFCAQCEHHLLPFYGVVHIGYFNDGRTLEFARDSLQSLVHFHGFRLQVQERLTRQIAEAVYSVARTGVIVVVEASHICMISRGIEKVRSSTATVAVMGRFLTDLAAKASFLRSVSDTDAQT